MVRSEPILAVLERHGVDYVMVGGYAARMHGASRPTRDVDVTPSTSVENLGRLAAALGELGARIRTEHVPEGLPFSVTGESLRGVRMLNLQTPYGELDLTIRPAAFEGGYDDLVARSTSRTVGAVTVRVAALEDVILSKETAGRVKDQLALPELLTLAGRAATSIPPPGSLEPRTQPASISERIAAARQALARSRESSPAPPGTDQEESGPARPSPDHPRGPHR